jgi:hypothetical protein
LALRANTRPQSGSRSSYRLIDCDLDNGIEIRDAAIVGAAGSSMAASSARSKMAGRSGRRGGVETDYRRIADARSGTG